MSRGTQFVVLTGASQARRVHISPILWIAGAVVLVLSLIGGMWLGWELQAEHDRRKQNAMHSR
jgi:hypothetical protein